MIHDSTSMDRSVARRPWWRRHGWALAAAGMLAVVLGLAGPRIVRWNSADRTVARSELRFGSVTRGPLEHAIAVEGRVVAASRPTLYSPAPGTVSLAVEEGRRIAAGDVLATIASPELESRLQQERATTTALESGLSRLALEARQEELENDQQVELAQVRKAAAARLVDRNQHLHELGLVNEIDLEASRDDFTIAGLELEQARQRRDMQRQIRTFEVADATARRDRQRLLVSELERQVAELRLAAPFDGLVATISVADRDAVVKGQALLGVVDLGDLEVEVEIPESAADQVVAGDVAVVTLDGVEHRGHVTRVAPEVRNSAVLGRVAFDDGVPPGLRQNQRLMTRLVLDERDDVLRVPRGPFLEAGGRRQVWVVHDGGIARRQPVEIGAVSVAEVEIVSGLGAGDEIVLSDMSRFGDAETVLLRN